MSRNDESKIMEFMEFAGFDVWHQWLYLRGLLFVGLIASLLAVAVLVGWWRERSDRLASPRAEQQVCDGVVESARPWPGHDDQPERRAA